MIFLYSILAFILFGIWRAWFGGSFGYCPRFIKYIVLCTMGLGCAYVADIIPTVKLDWLRLVLCLIFLCDHFAQSHGDYFLVNDISKDEGRVVWIDGVLRWLFGKDGYYNFAGNVCGMFLRYVNTAAWVSLTAGPLFLLSGFTTALGYGLCGKLWPDKWYTKAAEFLTGGMTGVLFFLSLNYTYGKQATILWIVALIISTIQLSYGVKRERNPT